MLGVVTLVNYLFTIAEVLVIARAVVSWVPSLRRHPVGDWLTKVVDPLLRPLQRLLPPWKTSGIDFSPMLALILLMIVRSIVIRMLLASAVPVVR